MTLEQYDPANPPQQVDPSAFGREAARAMAQEMMSMPVAQNAPTAQRVDPIENLVNSYVKSGKWDAEAQLALTQAAIAGKEAAKQEMSELFQGEMQKREFAGRMAGRDEKARDLIDTLLIQYGEENKALVAPLIKQGILGRMQELFNGNDTYAKEYASGRVNKMAIAECMKKAVSEAEEQLGGGKNVTSGNLAAKPGAGKGQSDPLEDDDDEEDGFPKNYKDMLETEYQRKAYSAALSSNIRYLGMERAKAEEAAYKHAKKMKDLRQLA